MLQASNFVDLNAEVVINMQTKPSGSFVVTFLVTGNGTWRFQTVNFDLSQKKRNYLSITLNADNVVAKVAFEPSFMC